MGLFNWGQKPSIPDDVYSVMNDDHVQLYRTIAELRVSIDTKIKGETERGFQHLAQLGLVARLIDQAKKHFVREEELMERYKYSDLRGHRREHLMLLRSVETYHANLISGARPLTRDVVTYLKSWLTNHIRTADRRLDQFLVSATKQPSLTSRPALGQHGESAWTVANSLLWATFQDAVSRETVNEHRQHNRDTIQEMQQRQQRNRDRELKESGRNKAARQSRQVRAIYFE